MNIKLNVNQKILIPVFVLLAITISVSTVLNINSQRKLIEDEEQQRLLTLNAAFQNTVEDREQMAVALATAFSEMSTVQQAFAEHNREALIAMLHSSYLQLDEKYGIPQSQFHLAPATSFLRLHKLEKFDDDLSAFRNTVLAANRELTPISGLEKGKGGYGVRGVVPVFYAGEHVGSFEMGMNFDEGLLLAFQAAYGPDVSVYFRDDLSKVDSFEEEEGTGTDEVILYPLYATTMEEPVEIDEQTKSIVFENDQSVTVRLEHGGIWYYGSGSLDMRDFAEFGKLEAPHIKLHTQVKEAVAAYNRGDKQHAESVAREVEGLSHEVVDLLDQVESHGLVLIKQASANGKGNAA